MSNRQGILGLGFRYQIELIAPDGTTEVFSVNNLVPDVGVNFIAGLIRGSGVSPTSNWYLGLFENDYVPTPAVAAADLPTTVGESTVYSSATRPAWAHSYDGSTYSIDNLSSRAEFAMTAAKSIYGAFIIDSSVKGGDSGRILSIARFPSPREVEDGTLLRIGAGLVLIPTEV